MQATSYQSCLCSFCKKCYRSKTLHLLSIATPSSWIYYKLLVTLCSSEMDCGQPQVLPIPVPNIWNTGIQFCKALQTRASTSKEAATFESDKLARYSELDGLRLTYVFGFPWRRCAENVVHHTLSGQNFHCDYEIGRSHRQKSRDVTYTLKMDF